MITNPTTIHNSFTIQPTVMLLLSDLLVVPLSGAQETTVTYTLLCGTLNTLINECRQPKLICINVMIVMATYRVQSVVLCLPSSLRLPDFHSPAPQFCLSECINGHSGYIRCTCLLETEKCTSSFNRSIKRLSGIC